MIPSVAVGKADVLERVPDTETDSVMEAPVGLTEGANEVVAPPSRVAVRVTEVTGVAGLSCLLTGTT